jgi:hypothetical protein
MQENAAALRAPQTGPRLVAGLPRLEAAFRAVESTIREIGPAAEGVPVGPRTMRTPQPVEDALPTSGALAGTLVILDPSELRSAEIDLEETVADERLGGAVYVSLPNPRDLLSRRVRYRDLAASSAGFAFVEGPAPSTGFGRFQFVPRPRALRRYRILLADTPGFRVAVVSRPLPEGGFVGLWTGNPEIVDEIADVMREAAREAGLEVPDAAPAVPPIQGISTEADVRRQAAQLRGLREIREGELREIARAAALRGVQLRRERALAAASRAAPRAGAA